MANPATNPNLQAMESLQMKDMMKALGLSDEAAEYMVIEQAINSKEMLINLDDDEISQLCKVCRKHQKTTTVTTNVTATPNVAAGAATRGRTAAAAATTGGNNNPTAQQTSTIDTGIAIAIIHETNLKLAKFYMRLMKMTSRKIVYAEITSNSVRAIKDFKTEIDNRKDPELETAPKITSDKLFDFFELFKEYLNEFTGQVSKRPLGYVVRKSVNVKNEADEPPFGQIDSHFMSRYHEIEMRAPIKTTMVGPNAVNAIQVQTDPHFVQDNIKVWKLLYGLLKDSYYLTYIKKYQKTQDGREAFFTLHEQLLGNSALDNHASKAENKISNLTLDGQKRKGWNFEKYVTAHMEQHQILEKLKNFGHSGIDENSKVRLFIKGITDPALGACAAAISANNKKTFDGVVGTYRTFIETQKSRAPQTKRVLNISSTNTQSGNRRIPANRLAALRAKTSAEADRFDPRKDYSEFKLDNRYYSIDQWIKLTKGQRNYLRANSNRKRGRTSKEVTTTKKESIQDLQRKVAAIQAVIDKHTKEKDPSEESEEDETLASLAQKSSVKRTRIARNN